MKAFCFGLISVSSDSMATELQKPENSTSAGLLNDWKRRQSASLTNFDFGGQFRFRLEHKEFFAAPGQAGAVDFAGIGGDPDNIKRVGKRHDGIIAVDGWILDKVTLAIWVRPWIRSFPPLFCVQVVDPLLRPSSSRSGSKALFILLLASKVRTRTPITVLRSAEQVGNPEMHGGDARAFNVVTDS